MLRVLYSLLISITLTGRLGLSWMETDRIVSLHVHQTYEYWTAYSGSCYERAQLYGIVLTPMRLTTRHSISRHIE